MTDPARGDRFENPLIDRYAGEDMIRLFSPRSRFGTWRELWLALANAQHELGLPVTREQIDELRSCRDQFDWDRLAALEAELRHDVMAHVHHWGELAPGAAAILHLGATSCFVTDNGDLMLYRQALRLLDDRLCRSIAAFAEFARSHRDLPCLGYTHYQVAQPVTVGKRACLWLQDLLLDLDEVRRLSDWLPCRGLKGTTGTQATFLSLCDGDHDKVRELEQRVAEAIGFDQVVSVTGQTYPRKIDWTLHQALSGIAQSAAKFATDIRLLSHDGELGEPREKKQIGSSAMAYKRNPMRSERVCALARYVIAAAETSAQTSAQQWLERTLDDSAVRRIAIPESFLAIDAILILVENVARGLRVFPEVIARRLRDSVPFLATEEILMAGVRAGGDRQQLHERIRVHSLEAAAAVDGGQSNPLLDLLAADPAFAAVADQLPELTEPSLFIGRAPQQVDEFLEQEVAPRLASFEPSERRDELRV